MPESESEPSQGPVHAGRDEIAIALGRRLGGTVRDLRRLSGGASRVTSAFDLDVGDDDDDRR